MDVRYDQVDLGENRQKLYLDKEQLRPCEHREAPQLGTVVIFTCRESARSIDETALQSLSESSLISCRHTRIGHLGTPTKRRLSKNDYSATCSRCDSQLAQFLNHCRSRGYWKDIAPCLEVWRASDDVVMLTHDIPIRTLILDCL